MFENNWWWILVNKIPVLLINIIYASIKVVYVIENSFSSPFLITKMMKFLSLFFSNRNVIIFRFFIKTNWTIRLQDYYFFKFAFIKRLRLIGYQIWEERPMDKNDFLCGCIFSIFNFDFYFLEFHSSLCVGNLFFCINSWSIYIIQSAMILWISTMGFCVWGRVSKQTAEIGLSFHTQSHWIKIFFGV